MSKASDITPISVNIDAETRDAITEMRRSDVGVNLTDMVRRAIILYHFIWKAKKTGRRIFLGNSDGKIEEELEFF